MSSNYKRRSKTKAEVEKQGEKKNNTIYFSSKHEKAIIDYSSTKDRKQREILYETLIEPVFEQMISKIVFTYKFNTLPNIDDLKIECKGWLTTVLDKFDPSKGSKAFSYFSVITKNWFIHKVKRNTERIKRETYFEELKNEGKEPDLIIYNDFHEEKDKEEYYDTLFAELLDWETDSSLRNNEKKVLQAIIVLLKNPDKIEIFNKKAIYLYIREMTLLNTKQIASSLVLLKARYKIFRNSWFEEIE
jgi:hypothetical protein